ncbi:MAG: energy-coupling factor transporter ATPase [Oscillospiraceae bacterium]|nr:energy-coupling factor transporter ATPase [Oscillospiraceae bacterium]
METIINAENISYFYDEETKKYVFKDLSLKVEKGSFVAVLGHNGSGKSTLAKHFNAILQPTEGKVYVNSMDTLDEDKLLEIRKDVGMVFQNPDNQIVATIVEDDVAFAPENLGVPHDELVIRVRDALKAVSMENFSDKAPHQLSGGQKQRVAIAGIIAMQPDCIVLDEATAMLDPKGRREVMEVVRRLNREMGITVVFITHYMEEAANADRVVVMDSGKIVLDGSPKEVFTQVETLKSIGLDVPQVTYLSYLLRGTKLELPKDILTASECADAILKLLEEKK